MLRLLASSKILLEKCWIDALLHVFINAFELPRMGQCFHLKFTMNFFFLVHSN